MYFACCSEDRIGVVNLLCDHSVSVEDTSIIMIGELIQYHYVSLAREIMTLHVSVLLTCSLPSSGVIAIYVSIIT